MNCIKTGCREVAKRYQSIDNHDKTVYCYACVMHKPLGWEVSA